MLKGFLGTLFRYTPKSLRRLFSRVTNARFAFTAGAVVTDDQGRVLLLKHVFRSGSGWGIPGGFVQAGEQPEAALRRELREEVGLELTGIELSFVRTLHTTQQVEVIFRARKNGSAEPQSVEIERSGWFSLLELPEGLSEEQRHLIERVLADGANDPG
jgi:8-oxo-dGTP diphosphatase